MAKKQQYDEPTILFLSYETQDIITASGDDWTEPMTDGY